MLGVSSITGFLLGGKKRKALVALIVIGGLGYLVWDYTATKQALGSAETKLEGWQDHAKKMRDAYREQRKKAKDAERSVRQLRAAREHLEDQKQQWKDRYETAKREDAELADWAGNPVPGYIGDRMRQLSNRAFVGSGESGGGNPEGAAGPASPPGEVSAETGGGNE